MSILHNNHLKNLIRTFLLLDFTTLMVKPSIKPSINQKQSCSIDLIKQAKN